MLESTIEYSNAKNEDDKLRRERSLKPLVPNEKDPKIFDKRTKRLIKNVLNLNAKNNATTKKRQAPPRTNNNGDDEAEVGESGRRLCGRWV
jgi:hypothetical protein